MPASKAAAAVSAPPSSNILSIPFTASPVMAGAGTIKADNPLLTARTEGLADPVRIIVDGRLSCSPDANVFQNPGRVIILTTTKADSDKIKDFEEAGVEIICADSDEPGKVDLEAAMTGLAERDRQYIA